MLMKVQPPLPVVRRIASSIAFVFCGILAPLGLGLGLLTRWYCSRSWDYKERWAGVWAFAVLFGVIYVLIFWFKHPFPFLFTAIWLDLRADSLMLAGEWLGILWAYNGILLAPLFALVYEALSPRTRRIRMQRRQRLPSAKQAREEARLAGQGFRQVGDILVGFPEYLGEHGVVGRPLGGDLWQWIIQGFFTYPLYALIYHALVVGRSGTGKSELLRRIAYLVAKFYRMKVVWVDGKGEWEDATRFYLTMEKAGCKQIGIFPTEPHNGWRGTRQDVLNLLMNCQLFESEYFKGVTYNILKMALYAPGLSPVTNSQELLRRLYPPTLKAIYKETPEYQYLQSLATDALWGPHGRYTAFFNGVLDRLDGSKGFGDWDAVYFLLDKKRLQQQIAPFARYLIGDFELYLALRQVKRKRQRILLVLDDYSAYSERVHIFDLFERVRSAGGCVVISAQGYKGLGLDAERLIEGAATSILFKCVLPKKLVEAAGTRKVPEISSHMQTGLGADGKDVETSQTTIRMVDEPRVQPNDVQQLQNGEVFFLCDGFEQKVAVERVELNEDRVEEMTTQLIQEYEAAQSAYEEAQVAALMNRPPVPAEDKARKRKGKKRQPPQPPQPQEVPVAPAHNGSKPASTALPAGQHPPSGATKRMDEERETPATHSEPQPQVRSIDDIE